MRGRLWLGAFFFLSVSPGSTAQERYRTENVILAVMDGTAWRQSFGDPEHRFIPRLWNEIRPQGTLYTNFYNNDVTITKGGHSTIASGTWQKSRNRGPRSTMPAIWHYLADEFPLPPEKVWVIFGKGKYAFDPSTSFPIYRDTFTARAEIGIGESSLQNDRDVYERLVQAMEKDRPRLVFVNFGATDHLAHSGMWERHIKAIQHQDELLTRLWQKVQQDPHYRDKTTLFLTNDHGYHLDGIQEGFAEHGDACLGCRQIMLLAVGPDIKSGAIVEKAAYQTDIAPTVGELFGVQTPLAQGEVLKECLVKFLGLNRKEARTERAREAVRIETLAAGNALKHLADQVLASYQAGGLSPAPDTTLLLWGMLSAYDKTGDGRYLDWVRSWAEKNLQATGEKATDAGLVFSELTYRLVDPGERAKFLAAAKRVSGQVAAGLNRGRWDGPAPELALQTIFLSSLAEAIRDQDLWQKSRDFLLGYLRQMDFKFGQAAALNLREPAAELKGGEDVVREEGKVVPTTGGPTGSSPDKSWILLALSFLRSHGLPFKGEYFVDVPDLRAEGILQTYLAVKDLPESGEIWPDPLQAALNITAIKEFQRRRDLYEDLDWLNEFEFVRLRPDSPEVLPRLEEVRRHLGKVTATNYNVAYGFPRYRDFDYTIDLLRLYVEQAQSTSERGAFLLALDASRRIGFEPFFPSPREQ